MDLVTFLIQCLNSIQYGLLLFLVASGLTLIFGIMGAINLAHGSFYMIGAYMLDARIRQGRGGGQERSHIVGVGTRPRWLSISLKGCTSESDVR